MRRHAIGLMGQAFECAHAVLVIDAGIRSCSIKAPVKEQLLCIMTSMWMHRMWTFQEAVLAPDLFFEFSDGLMPARTLLAAASDETDTTIMALKSQLAPLLFRSCMRPAKHAARWEFGWSLGFVSQSLKRRTTSKLEDETLAIARLLDVDSYELVNLPPQDRMSSLLLKLRNIPTDIVFTHAPRLDRPRFRWAPKTFMGHGTALSLNYDAICTPDGLLAEYICVLFPATRFPSSEMLWFLDGLPDGMRAGIRNSGVTQQGITEVTCNAILLKSTDQRLSNDGIAILIDAVDNCGRGGCRMVGTHVMEVAFMPLLGKISQVGNHRIIDALLMAQLPFRLT
ncbi:hypothetical protein OBBRIDRAFT_546417 [Obba rivulosa]|uniref:Heterokaryon incompatibility domain-containing protein n=1 Tax=Obba rivulosa TaxID=1052685 RepID=A0A8E2AZW9_9APHY|nr:hypothetical protein OBBRIDRAFT_546417 [Obba rivulosa]